MSSEHGTPCNFQNLKYVLNCLKPEWTRFEYFDLLKGLNSADDQVVRASASGVVNSGLITSRVKPMTLKLLFTVSMLDAQD